MTGKGVATPIGELELIVSLEPSCPFAFEPQHIRVPDKRTEQVCKLPSEIEATPESIPKTKPGLFCCV
jgi:hypothetical protein